MYKLSFCFILVLAGCDTYKEEQRSIDYEPVYLSEDIGSEFGPNYGGIYSPAKGALFSMETRAHKVGDIITVAFAESFQATKSQNAATKKSSSNSIDLPNILDPLLRNGAAPVSADLTTGSNSSFAGSGSTAQSNSLRGSVSVHVVRVYPNGNLQILGQKKLTFNNGDEYIRVSGIVRPMDIAADNVVQSDRIANADINYVGAGDIARTGKKGWFTRVFENVSPL